MSDAIEQAIAFLSTHQVKVVHHELEPKDLPRERKVTMKPKIARLKTALQREAAILKKNSAFDFTGKGLRGAKPSSRQVGIDLNDPDSVQALAQVGWRRVVG